MTITGALSSGTSGDALAGVVADLSAGCGTVGAPPATGPGDQFRFGATGVGVADGTLNADLLDPLGIGGTTAPTTASDQADAVQVDGGDFAAWAAPLDYAFGGIFRGTGDTWAAAAAGAYLARWRSGLESLRDSFAYDHGALRVCFGGGLNVSGSDTHVASGETAHALDAVRLWADLVRELIPGARRVLSLSAVTSSTVDPFALWPGRRWVDAVQVETVNASPHSTSPSEVTTAMSATSGGRPVGVEAWRTQAAAWGVPLAVRWGNPTGTGGGDAPDYVTGMVDWFQAHAGDGPGQVPWALYRNEGATQILPVAGSSQPLGAAELAAATALSVVVGGASNYTPPAGQGTYAVVGSSSGLAAPPAPGLPALGSYA